MRNEELMERLGADEVAVARFRTYTPELRGDGCWEWAGRRDWKGYGIFSYMGKQLRATRVALHLDGQREPSPEHHACHACDNPPCVNPSHLWWGTKSQNMLDSHYKGRNRNSGRDCCAAGHKYEPGTWRTRMRNGRPSRVCRICQDDYKRAFFARRSTSLLGDLR